MFTLTVHSSRSLFLFTLLLLHFRVTLVYRAPTRPAGVRQHPNDARKRVQSAQQFPVVHTVADVAI